MVNMINVVSNTRSLNIIIIDIIHPNCYYHYYYQNVSDCTDTPKPRAAIKLYPRFKQRLIPLFL